jgi:hypothetical protein
MQLKSYHHVREGVRLKSVVQLPGEKRDNAWPGNFEEDRNWAGRARCLGADSIRFNN